MHFLGADLAAFTSAFGVGIDIFLTGLRTNLTTRPLLLFIAVVVVLLLVVVLVRGGLGGLTVRPRRPDVPLRTLELGIILLVPILIRLDSHRNTFQPHRWIGIQGHCYRR